jgi:hypothetical protein
MISSPHDNIAAEIKEIVNVTYVGDTLATKATGDVNVPRGKLRFLFR